MWEQYSVQSGDAEKFEVEQELSEPANEEMGELVDAEDPKKETRHLTGGVQTTPHGGGAGQ